MFGTATTGGSVIDEPAARTVTEAYWNARRAALHPVDVAAIAAIETEPAASWDAVSCGCYSFGPAIDITLTAADQQSYPANFLAEVHSQQTEDPTGNTEDVTDLIVFLRPEAKSPWRAAFDVGYAGDAKTINDPITEGTVPFGFPVPEVMGDRQPSDLPKLFADYYQSWHDNGRPPDNTPFSDSGAPADIGRIVAKSHEDMIADGVSDVRTYRSGVEDDGLFVFAAGPRAVLACSTVHWDSDYRAGPSSPVIQPTDTLVFPYYVAPGSYRRITLVGVNQACFWVNTQTDHVAIRATVGGSIYATTELN